MSATNKSIVQDINDAFSTNEIGRFLDHCSDQIVWTMVDKPSLHGKQAIRDFMDSMSEPVAPPKMYLNRIIAEGNMVAADGGMEMKNADGSDYRGAFCDIYQFKDGKIEELISYIVDLKDAD